MPTKAELIERVAELTKRNKDLEGQLNSPCKSSKKKVKRAPSPYALFVKEKFGEVKTEFPDKNASECMKKIAIMWNILKEEKGK